MRGRGKHIEAVKHTGLQKCSCSFVLYIYQCSLDTNCLDRYVFGRAQPPESLGLTKLLCLMLEKTLPWKCFHKQETGCLVVFISM